MNAEQMRPFCEKPDGIRFELRDPVYLPYRDLSVATNGVVMVLTRGRVEGAVENGMSFNVNVILPKEVPVFDFVVAMFPLPSLPAPEFEECGECKGHGKKLRPGDCEACDGKGVVDCDCCGQAMDCEECGGEGSLIKDDSARDIPCEACGESGQVEALSLAWVRERNCHVNANLLRMIVKAIPGAMVLKADIPRWPAAVLFSDGVDLAVVMPMRVDKDEGVKA